jgi:hypothetical protein
MPFGKTNEVKIPKPDATKFYVCIENHTGPHGTFKADGLGGPARLKGDHPDVVKNTIFWVEEHLDEDQRHGAHQERIDSLIIANETESSRHQPSGIVRAPADDTVEWGRN